MQSNNGVKVLDLLSIIVQRLGLIPSSDVVIGLSNYRVLSFTFQNFTVTVGPPVGMFVCQAAWRFSLLHVIVAVFCVEVPKKSP